MINNDIFVLQIFRTICDAILFLPIVVPTLSDVYGSLAPQGWWRERVRGHDRVRVSTAVDVVDETWQGAAVADAVVGRRGGG